MNVTCPACSKQHRVADQMVGKRAKCVCGQVMTVEATSSQQSPSAVASPSPTPQPIDSGDQSAHGEILFECRYGVMRKFMWWLMGANFLIALALIPAGFLWNDGWELNGAPLPPLATMLLFEGVGFGLLLLIAYMLAGHFIHRDKPQRVAITTEGVIIPKGKLSVEELFIPWDEVRVKHWGGPVDQLDFKQDALKSRRLTSAQFDSNTSFDAFFSHLQERGKI